MRPIDTGPFRPIAALARAKAVNEKSHGENGHAANAASHSTAGQAFALSITVRELKGDGTPPIDQERVATIRKAVESGNYPLVPARVADALIAASLLLRTGE